MKKKKLKSALQFPAYAKFVDQRDSAAEKMLGHAKLAQADAFRYWLLKLSHVVGAFLLKKPKPKDLKKLDSSIHSVFNTAVPAFVFISQDLRKKAYVLAIVSEAEALGRILGKAQYKVTQTNVTNFLKSDSMAGGLIYDRVVLYFDRLRREVLDVVQAGLVRGLESHEIMDRVIRKLPNVKRQRQVRVLSKIREAESDKRAEDIAIGFVDDVLWDQIVSDYKDEYIPQWRGPEFEIDPSEPGWPIDEKVYATDIERDMTEDFVKAVREGQIEAATQNGIDDFVWIAIIDKSTCEDCCIPRDGLLASEIQKMVDDGDLEGCDAVTPPAHINCRCRLAPVIDSDQEPVTVDTEGFENWAEG